ncbi:MAG: hypothetical protein ACSHX6_10335 [Akkermansiaceae bacterium]
MAHNVTSKDLPLNGEQVKSSDLALPKLISLVIFIVGAIFSFFLFTNDTFGDGYSYSWLFAFMFFISLTLGGCFWTTLHNVTNSGWGVSVRRLMENLGFVFPFMAVIAIPLMIPSVQNDLYEWMETHRDIATEYIDAEGNTHENDRHQIVTLDHAHVEKTEHGAYTSPDAATFNAAHEALLAQKAWYMNLPFWLVRIISFFALLGAGIWIQRKMSMDQDVDPKPTCARLIKTRQLSCIIMPIFAVVATFIALDFMMALDYKWFSTMYGVYFFAGCALNSMAVLMLTLVWLRKKGYLQTVTSTEHFHIMGKLLFAFVVFWAYVSFAQFMLIWYANITEETSYFILRNTGAWWGWSLSLVFGHFALPFVLLLPHYVKKVNWMIVSICSYILIYHIIDLYIAVIPERGVSLTHGENLFVEHAAYLGDIVAFITVGAFFVFMFLRNIGSSNTYPNRDPRILESANLHN